MSFWATLKELARIGMPTRHSVKGKTGRARKAARLGGHTMSDNAWLQKLKPGDTVFISQPYCQPERPAVVSRITNTQVVTRRQVCSKDANYEERFRRLNGRSVGNHGRFEILKDTPERRMKWHIETLTQKAVSMRGMMAIPDTEPELLAFIEAIKPFVKTIGGK